MTTEAVRTAATTMPRKCSKSVCDISFRADVIVPVSSWALRDCIFVSRVRAAASRVCDRRWLTGDECFPLSMVILAPGLATAIRSTSPWILAFLYNAICWLHALSRVQTSCACPYQISFTSSLAAFATRQPRTADTLHTACVARCPHPVSSLQLSRRQ